MRSFSFVIVLLTLTGLGLFGCSTNQQVPAQATTMATQTEPTLSSDQNQGLQVLLANSRNLVGKNRFPVGVIRNGKSVQNAQVHLKFFDINGDGVITSADMISGTTPVAGTSSTIGIMPEPVIVRDPANKRDLKLVAGSSGTIQAIKNYISKPPGGRQSWRQLR